MLSTSLKQQCDTRWNSIYDMLFSIELNFKEVESVLLERKEYSQYMDEIDYTLMKNLIDILSSFKKASEQLSADQEPTLHLVLPCVNKLKNHCQAKTTDTAVVKQMKKLLLHYIEEKIWLTQLHDIATFLHPLSKNLLVSSRHRHIFTYISDYLLLFRVFINLLLSVLQSK